MEGEVLLLKLLTAKLENPLEVYGNIGPDNLKLYITIKGPSYQSRVYKMIIWTRGVYKRVYLHKKNNYFSQFGYIEIEEGLPKNYKVDNLDNIEGPIKNVFDLIIKHVYTNRGWEYPGIVINEKSIELIRDTKKPNKQPDTPSIKQNDLNRKTEVKERYINTTASKSILNYNNKSVKKCHNCRYRKECFDMYKISGDCKNYEEGAAVSDYTQWG